MHLRYTIQAPIGTLLPLVPRLLRDERRFDLVREPGRMPAWRLRRLLDGRDLGRIVLRRVDDQASELLAAPASTNGSRVRPVELEPALSAMVQRLQHEGFHPTPARPAQNDATERVVLLVSPATRFFGSLATRLAPLVASRGMALRRPLPEASDDALALARDVYAADVVVADLSDAQGWDAAQAAIRQKKALIALAPEGKKLPAPWPGPVLTFGEQQQPLLDQLAQRLDDSAPTDQAPRYADTFPTPSPALDRTEAAPVVPPGGEGERRSPRPGATPALGTLAEQRPDEARLALYQSAALDPHASPERRFHAARVLLTAGARDLAAAALGEVARAATPLRDEALELLGTLGGAARVALWALDATEENPERSVAIARQLHAAGDTTTARLRLERLARHPDREVRLAALHALGDLGLRAASEFATLARTAEDPRMRLDAARWLRLKGLDTPLVVETLAALADQPDRVPLSLDALNELSAVAGREGTDALVKLARQARLSDLRLAAAQALASRSDTEEARATLLAIAQGEDEEAAPAALEALFDYGETAPSDTERLMLGAALFSVRRRAAAQLAKADQPEPVQQTAARVLIALDRADLAMETLRRLALIASDDAIRRWAVDQLAELSAAAIGPMFEVLEATSDRAAGLRLAEALLRVTSEPRLRRRVALWLSEQGASIQAVEVLGTIAQDPRVAENEALLALNDLLVMAPSHPRAVRMLGELAARSPHTFLRNRALSYLSESHLEELPLSMLIDMALTRDQPADLMPLLDYLAEVSPAAVQRIVEEILLRETPPSRRWKLLNLLQTLPGEAALSGLHQLAARAPGATLQAVVAGRLIDLGDQEAGYATLASLAQSSAHPEVRRRSIKRLFQGGEEAVPFLRLIAARSSYVDARETAQMLLRGGRRGSRASPFQRLVGWWEDLVARLPLGWLDRLLGIKK